MAAVLVAFVAAASLLGCASGTVHTSTGADVAAPIVITQDAVADVLSGFEKANNLAVAAYEAGATKPRALHDKLERQAEAITAGLEGIRAWKVAGGGAPPKDVFCALVAVAPDLLSTASGYGIFDPAKAKAAAETIATLAKAGGCQ
jgi:hypothetical protein